MEEKIKLKELQIEDYSKWKDYYYIVNDTYYFLKEKQKIIPKFTKT